MKNGLLTANVEFGTLLRKKDHFERNNVERERYCYRKGEKKDQTGNFFIASCRTHSENSQSRVTGVFARKLRSRAVCKGKDRSPLHLFPDSSNSPNSYFFPPTHTACTCPRELPRQSCLDKHERFVCIVLRQRQHVSRTRYFSLTAYRRVPGRGKNSSVRKFYLPLANAFILPRKYTLALSIFEPFIELRDKEQGKRDKNDFRVNTLFYYANLSFINVPFVSPS